MPRTAADQLAGYRQRYQQLAAQIAEVGLIHSGSLLRVQVRCGKANCRCHAEPPVLHGPYWQWSTKVAGKTVSRRLSDAEAELYREWIGNDRRLRALIAEMRTVSGKATALLIKQAEHGRAKV